MTPDFYRIYLRFNDTDVLLPLTPSSITISNEDKTEVFTMADGRPFTLARFDGPQTISFDFQILTQSYPFTFKDAETGIRFYTDLMWNIKAQKGPIGITIIRKKGEPYTDMKVLLQDYSYVEDAENANDYTFSVTFVSYYPQNNYEAGARAGEKHLVKANRQQDWATKTYQQLLADDRDEKKQRYQDKVFLDRVGWK